MSEKKIQTMTYDLNEDEAEILIEEHLRDRGWNLTDFDTTRKRWRKHLDASNSQESVVISNGRDDDD